jgi:hypothetical protein
MSDLEQATFTYDLEEVTERYRRRLAALPRAKGMPPLDTSGIAIRTDEQIRYMVAGIGRRNGFEINHWFSLVSWSREAGDRLRLVVEGEGSQFEAACEAITVELGKRSD